MPLRAVTFGMNQYCGPAVLSAFTGKTTDECAAVIAGITGGVEIKAVNTIDLIIALNKLRFDVEAQKVQSYTLYGTLSKIASSDGLYVVVVPRHVVAIEVRNSKIFFVDNHTKEPIDAASSARLSQAVSQVYKVIPRPAPKLLRSIVKAEKGYGNNIHIRATDEYEDPRDNAEMDLGRIYFRSSDELDHIMFELGSVFAECREKELNK